MGLLGSRTPYCGSPLLGKGWIHTSLKRTCVGFSCDTFLWYLKTKDFLLKNLKLFPGLKLKAALTSSRMYRIYIIFPFFLTLKGPFATFKMQYDRTCEWTGLKFSNDGKLILISTNGGFIRLIDAFKGAILHTFGVSRFCGTSSKLDAAVAAGALRLWDCCGHALYYVFSCLCHRVITIVRLSRWRHLSHQTPSSSW